MVATFPENPYSSAELDLMRQYPGYDPHKETIQEYAERMNHAFIPDNDDPKNAAKMTEVIRSDSYGGTGYGVGTGNPDEVCLADVLRRVEQLHDKVDKIVEIVEETINNLGNNPMMKMLGSLGGKKN